MHGLVYLPMDARPTHAPTRTHGRPHTCAPTCHVCGLISILKAALTSLLAAQGRLQASLPLASRLQAASYPLQQKRAAGGHTAGRAPSEQQHHSFQRVVFQGMFSPPQFSVGHVAQVGRSRLSNHASNPWPNAQHIHTDRAPQSSGQYKATPFEHSKLLTCRTSGLPRTGSSWHRGIHPQTPGGAGRYPGYNRVTAPLITHTLFFPSSCFVSFPPMQRL
jgi:hypothetical protein